MKLGTENRKELIILGLLGVLALVLVARMLWPSAPETSQAMTPATSSTAPTATRRTASEETKYEGNGRNIFAMGSVPPIPVPKAPGVTDLQAAQRPAAPVYAPPPISLKFFGFANRPGEPKRIFLAGGPQNEDVFIAGEGDIVDRRYRVLHIAPNAVEIEDVLNNNRQSIPLTQG